jgi:hypothetical protein
LERSFLAGLADKPLPADFLAGSPSTSSNA